MNAINLTRKWDYITAEVHREKPNRTNLFRRETLFALRVLLSQYEFAKGEKNKKLMKFCADILETYEKYDINRHIMWKE